MVSGNTRKGDLMSGEGYPVVYEGETIRVLNLNDVLGYWALDEHLQNGFTIACQPVLAIETNIAFQSSGTRSIEVVLRKPATFQLK